MQSPVVTELHPSVRAGLAAQRERRDALRTMIDHKVRRLPVIDERKLVGIISQADIATHLDEEKVGDLVEAISAAP